MIVVADSSPLIALSRVGRLDLLHTLFGHLVLPDAVWAEVAESGPPLAGAAELLAATWIEHRAVKDTALVNLLRQDLGAGESEAIVLARELQADVLLMDERLGRTAAKRLGLTVTGLVGILIEARQRGILADATALAEELKSSAGFWISDDLMKLIAGP